MRPQRIIIPGRFWDSLIYSGRLYLVGIDGTYETLDWDQVVVELSPSKRLSLAFEAAFSRSDYLYSRDFEILFRDPDVKRLLLRKFGQMSKRGYELGTRQRARARIGVGDLKLPFPYADATIYLNSLYAVGGQGVFRATVGKRTKYGISSRPARIWDCPGYSISASWGSLAVAAGTEGLHEHFVGSDRYWWYADDGHMHDSNGLVLTGHTTLCNYAYQSIYASSALRDGALAEFSRPRRDGSGPQERRIEEAYRQRHFEREHPAATIFGGVGEFSWGSQDKLCQARGSTVRVVRYRPWGDRGEPTLSAIGELHLEQWKGSVVSGGVATFGVIIEADNALVILPSAGDPITLPGEPVRWRFFPRSRLYENQLHVIYEDRLEILSFNHDYFVDQHSKVAGTAYWRRPIVRSSG
jgi:hypothetical protein